MLIKTPRGVPSSFLSSDYCFILAWRPGRGEKFGIYTRLSLPVDYDVNICFIQSPGLIPFSPETTFSLSKFLVRSSAIASIPTTYLFSASIASGLGSVLDAKDIISCSQLATTISGTIGTLNNWTKR